MHAKSGPRRCSTTGPKSFGGAERTAGWPKIDWTAKIGGMALLRAPAPADFSGTIGSPTVNWNTGNDSVIVSYRGGGMSINGLVATPSAGWTRLQAEMFANGGTLQAGSFCFAGICLYENAGTRCTTFSYKCNNNGGNGLAVDNWNNRTGSYNSTPVQVPISRPRFFKIEADSTGASFYWSDDWDDIGYPPALVTVTWASWLGVKPDRIAVYASGDSILSGGGGTNMANLVGWLLE